jgi:hypothetical protein
MSGAGEVKISQLRLNSSCNRQRAEATEAVTQASIEIPGRVCEWQRSEM